MEDLSLCLRTHDINVVGCKLKKTLIQKDEVDGDVGLILWLSNQYLDKGTETSNQLMLELFGQLDTNYTPNVTADLEIW
jgi:hypothetical protein